MSLLISMGLVVRFLVQQVHQNQMNPPSMPFVIESFEVTTNNHANRETRYNLNGRTCSPTQLLEIAPRNTADSKEIVLDLYERYRRSERHVTVVLLRA
jgi:hypothetical protein